MGTAHKVYQPLPETQKRLQEIGGLTLNLWNEDNFEAAAGLVDNVFQEHEPLTQIFKSEPGELKTLMMGCK